MVKQEQSVSDNDDGNTPVFKAINVDKRRRGIRLEKRFWSALDQISKHNGHRISDIIVQLEKGGQDTKNTASMLRVYALDWFGKQYQALKNEASLRRIQAQVTACPTPTFTLSSKSGLKFYNAAFIQYIRSNVPVLELNTMHNKLQLKIDMNTTELIEQLKDKGIESVSLGFVIGLGSHHIRGKLKATLAFADDEYFIIGYITS